MIEVSKLSKCYEEHVVLHNVSFCTHPGKLYGLIGPSGGGKSTILKILGGVETPTSGVILRGSGKGDEPVSGSFSPFSSNQNRQNKGLIQTGEVEPSSVGLMFQEGALFDSLTVLDNVAFPLVGGRVPIMTLGRGHRRVVVETAMAVLAKVGLSSAAHKFPSQLSGGMRRRASLARALVCNPSVMLLDDPTSGLDPVASSVIMELITSIHQSLGGIAIIASHDLRRLLPVVDELICLFDGTVRFMGSLAELKGANDERVKAFTRCRFDLDN
jgi:phospholipid/cholesterol/gamma-HCH transport system ATP-binding protein